MAFLPFLGPTFNRISTWLSRHNIKTLGLPPRKVTRQIGRFTETRIREHHRHIPLYHPEKSVTAEHSMNSGHRIHFHEISILAEKSERTERLVMETTETELHPDNMNWEKGFSLSRSWRPLVRILKERKKALYKVNKLTPACFYRPLISLIWAIRTGSYPTKLPLSALLAGAQSGTLPRYIHVAIWPYKGSPSEPFPHRQGLDSPPGNFYL